MAIPFAWVKTEEEAHDLIVKFCSRNHVRQVYQIRRTWDLDDVAAAVVECRRHFRLDD